MGVIRCNIQSSDPVGVLKYESESDVKSKLCIFDVICNRNYYNVCVSERISLGVSQQEKSVVLYKDGGIQKFYRV